MIKSKTGKTIKDLKSGLKIKKAGVNTVRPVNNFIEFAEKDIYQTIVSRFAGQVEGNPGAIAIKTPFQTVTYEELNARANRTARAIRQLYGDGKQGAALLLDHGPDMITAVLGVLKSGMYYVPLAPDFPLRRLAYMLLDSDTKILITNHCRRELAERLVEETGGHIQLLDLETIDKALSSENPDIPINPGDTAYILYTSGSTGTPKGLGQSHLYVLHLISSFTNTLRISPGDHITLLPPFIFSASVMDMFGALLNNASLHPMDVKNESIPDLLHRIHEEEISIYHSVPTLFRHLVSSMRGDEEFPGLRLIYLAGEQLLRRDVEMYRKSFPGHCLLVNGMGCTEFNICRQYFMDKTTEVHSGVVPVGYPAPGVEVKILDEDRCETGHNTVGEIALISRYLPGGYWKRPDLTRDKFLPGPRPGEIIFLTGDIGRISPDGCLTHLGRKDSMVKIRGQRVELAEIENVLDKITGIAKSVVTAHKDQTGEIYIAAYYAKEKGIEIEENTLRQEARELLPEYMIPRVFINVIEFPLTASGKIDSKSLPEPDPSQLKNESGEEYITPGNWLEEKLISILSAVLEVEKDMINIAANFFALGGNSLNAMELAAEIHKELNVKIPLAEIFNHTTVKELARYIKAANIDKYTCIEPVEKKEYYGISPGQKRLYILQRMEKENTSYNLSLILPLKGKPDMARLEDTFHRLIARQESLRTSFQAAAREPVQRIHDEVEFQIEYFNPNGQSTKQKEPPGPAITGGPGRTDHHLSSIIDGFIRPFDLSRAPLLRVGVIKAGASPYILMVDMHHIITDGISQVLLTKEFMKLSAGEELPPLRLRYKDYSQWQQSPMVKEVLEIQEEYWLKEFATGIPVLNRFADFTRPAIKSFAGRRASFEIGQKETVELKQLALEEGATLFMVLLTIFNIMIGKISGQEDIVVGTDTAGRRHADLANVIGVFVNMLALRNFPKSEKTFKGLLREVKDRTLKAFENQDYQFDDLVERLLVHRDTGRNPIFDVVFSYLDLEENPEEAPGQENPGLNREPYTHESRTARFDLAWAAVKRPGHLLFNIEYSTALFKPGTIEKFISYFKGILSSVIGNPYARLEEIEMVSAEEEKRLLNAIPDNAPHPYPEDINQNQRRFHSPEAEFDFLQ